MNPFRRYLRCEVRRSARKLFLALLARLFDFARLLRNSSSDFTRFIRSDEVFSFHPRFRVQGVEMAIPRRCSRIETTNPFGGAARASGGGDDDVYHEISSDLIIGGPKFLPIYTFAGGRCDRQLARRRSLRFAGQRYIN